MDMAESNVLKREGKNVWRSVYILKKEAFPNASIYTI